MCIATLNAIAAGIAASPLMAAQVRPPQVPEGSPSLADQNWARTFIHDYTADATKNPNWKPPRAVIDTLAEAHDIVARADKLLANEKAREDVVAHALSGLYGLI